MAVTIQNFCELFIKNLVEEEKVMELITPVRNYTAATRSTSSESEDDKVITAETKGKKRKFCLETSKTYAQMFSIAGIVAETLPNTISQRDIYYSLKYLFHNQTECNRRILELGEMLGLRRHEMGISPAARGLIELSSSMV